MESTAVRVLALLGLAAVVVCLALLCARPIVAALDGALKKWRRLGIVPRVVAVLMAAIATVEAQKSGMGDSNRVERVDRVDGGGGDFSRKEHKESVWVDGEELKLGVEVEQRTDKPSAVQLGPEASTITSTHRLASVKTNDSYSYAMPENAVRYPNWWMRGGYEDVFKLELGDWRFPIGTNLVDYLWVFIWGKVRPQLKAKELEIAAVGAPMSAVPQVSEFWYADGANGSKILTWHNFFLGRIPITVPHSPFPIPHSLQLELFPNGDYIARSNLVERYFKRINPDDFDDDGITDGVDENPELSDGDFFGPDNDLPEGANSNNYCWVDVVVSNANSLVTFIGDRPSNLPDPYFIAKPDVTNRVTLLIGKTYRVTSAQPIICTAKSNDDIIIDVHDSHSMTICCPVSYEIVDMARFVSRQIRMIPPSLVGTFNWNTNTCCTQVQTTPSELPKCAWDCACEGCTLGGFTFDYEGYSLDFGGIYCGCATYSGPEEDVGPYAASASVAFSKRVVIFEDAYTNTPLEIISRKSTRTTLTCLAHGGPNGGRAIFSIANSDKLLCIGGVDLPLEVDIPAGHRFLFNIDYEGIKSSDDEDDIVATARFVDNVDGVIADATSYITVVELELRPVVEREGCEKRHIWGIGEVIECELTPKIDKWAFIAEGGSITNFTAGYSHYTVPMSSSDNFLSVKCDRDFYVPEIRALYPEKIVVGKGSELLYGVGQGVAGGIGMLLELYLSPTTVSFSRIAAMEVPSTNNIVNGYFLDVCFSNMWSHSTHNGAGEWHNVGIDNFFFNDEACMGDALPEPWESGTIIWNVPIEYRSRDSVINERFALPVQYTQSFSIDSAGTVKVEKFGLWVERLSSGVRNRSKGIDVCE